MFNFYMKRSFVDTAPDISAVNIHYTWSPVGEPPDWEAHRETRSMPRGGVLSRGMGGTTVDEQGQWVQSDVETVELPDDGTRRKVLRLPKQIESASTGGFTNNYAFHHYFEVFSDGKRDTSQLYSEDITTKEVEYLDFRGDLGGMCIFWSIYDWDAPQYEPTEVPAFIEKFGDDSPYRSFKFYGAEDKENFSRIRSEMLASLPLPRRYVGTIYGPRGAQIHQRWHVGSMWNADPGKRWEDYWGYVVHLL